MEYTDAVVIEKGGSDSSLFEADLAKVAKDIKMSN